MLFQESFIVVKYEFLFIAKIRLYHELFFLLVTQIYVSQIGFLLIKLLNLMLDLFPLFVGIDRIELIYQLLLLRAQISTGLKFCASLNLLFIFMTVHIKIK